MVMKAPPMHPAIWKFCTQVNRTLHAHHALVEILGPDLQDNSKSRGIVITLLQQFGFSDSYRTVVESIKSSQELIISARYASVDLQLFVPPLTKTFVDISFYSFEKCRY